MNASLSTSILLVDPDRVETFRLKQVLEEMGFTAPFLTDTVETASNIIVQQQPRLIICDLFFDHEPNGLTLLHQFADRSKQFIMVTSSGEQSLYEQTQAVGVSGHLVKPFHPLTLRSVIDQALGKQPVVEVSRLSGVFIPGAHNQQVRIEFSDILYIYSERNYISIKTKESRFTLKRSLSKMNEQLDERFLRVHNSYIVNIDCLKAFAITTLLIDKEIIPLGRAFRKNFTNRIETRQLNENG